MEDNNKEFCFITGCDSEYEWAIPWWFDNFCHYNSNENVILVDYGISDKYWNWCAVNNFKVIPGNNHCFNKVWFNKPLILRDCGYKYASWIDIDCEIRKNLSSMIHYAKMGFAVTIDKYAWFCKNKYALATGVIAVNTLNTVLSEWCDYTINNFQKYRGDQEVLEDVAAKYRKGYSRFDKNITIMPDYMQWLRIAGDNNPETAIMHWTGPDGNNIIKKQIKDRNIVQL